MKNKVEVKFEVTAMVSDEKKSKLIRDIQKMVNRDTRNPNKIKISVKNKAGKKVSIKNVTAINML